LVAAAATAPPEGVYGGGGAGADEPGTGGGVFLKEPVEGMLRIAGGDRVELAALALDADVADRPRLLPPFALRFA